ncbi:HdeD family acid-resistance protein [Natrialbaceae archaeon GCM10025810]|uniref:HdeD family acid-resistance protein n=1 Tax=Halovalidus salilacus TaxID=3075124 RepID=UPI00360820D2
MNSTQSPRDVEYTPRAGWRTLAIAGAIVGLLGLVAMTFPFATGLSVSIALGALLIVGGIVHGAHAFSARGWTGRFWQLALGAVSVVAGAVLIANPTVGLLSLTLIAIAYLFVDGIAELAASVRMGSQPGRAWVGVSGVISLVLAAMLWVGFPADAAWAVGLLVGVSVFATGLSMALIAISGRELEEDVAPPAGEPRGA